MWCCVHWRHSICVDYISKNMSLLGLEIKMLSFKIIFKWKVSHVPLFFLYKPCVCTSREKAIIWLPIKFPWSRDNTEAITLQHSGYWKAECLHRVLWKNADCIVYSHLTALVQNNYTLWNTRFPYPQPAFLKLCLLSEDRPDIMRYSFTLFSWRQKPCLA